MAKTQANDHKVIVLTGGHAGTTALAVINEFRNRHKNWKLHWIGPQKAHEGTNILTIEAKILPQYGVNFHPIRAGKLQRKWSRHTIPTLLRFPFGFIDAFSLIRTIKPNLILSFGGYAAFPVVVIAKLLHVPVVLQEQITGLGFANRISLPFADKVALAREEGLKPAKGKGVVLGNPVNPELIKLKRKTRKHVPPRIFIFPGSRGSKQINALVKPLLRPLLEKFIIYHHTGDLDYEEFSSLKRTISHSNNYFPFKFIDPSRVPDYYKESDILIGRAGANTVTEIMVVGIPSILIPLTWTNYQEQVLNARNAEKCHFAKVFLPDEVTSEKLYESIIEIDKNWMEIIKTFDYSLANLDKTATQKIVDMVEVLCD